MWCESEARSEDPLGRVEKPISSPDTLADRTGDPRLVARQDFELLRLESKAKRKPRSAVCARRDCRDSDSAK